MIDQKQLENLEYFRYGGGLIAVMQDAQVKLNPGLPWQVRQSARRRRRLFEPANGT
jgi:hypothetical protein